MRDRRGCPVSTASDAAQEHVEQALWRLSSFYGDPLGDLEAASAADPGWMLPHVMRAGFLLTLTERHLLAAAAEALDAAARCHGNERERAHLAAAQRALAGDWLGACERWEGLLLDHPRDALALQLAHLFDFYRGDARELRLRVARVLPEWPRNEGLYPYVLGMYAFGLEENHLYPQAEAVGREALDGGARVPWAVHAVAHVMEMQGRHDEGRAWLQSQRRNWSEDDNGLRGHNAWHLALFHLEAMDLDGALQVYDNEVAPLIESGLTLQRLDAAALLWRLQLLGAGVGPRCQALAARWALDADATGHYAFNDVHALMACLGAGDVAGAEALLSRVIEQAQTQPGLNRAMAQEVGLPLMRGLIAFARQDWDTTVTHLAPLRAVAHRFGGSHAQRDLIDLTLMSACARGAHRALGRALLNERVLAKGTTPQVAHWRSRLG
jgi:hypothetical protein